MKLAAGIVVMLGVAGGIAWTVSWRSSATERELEGAYARLDAAMQAKDSAAFMEMLSPDYIEFRLNKTVYDRKQTEANCRQNIQDWSSIRRQSADIYQFKVQGDRAFVTVHRVTEGTLTDRAGAFGPKGNTHEMVTDTMNVDVWDRSAQRWKMRQRHIAQAAIQVDGKLLASERQNAHSEHDHESHAEPAHSH